MKTAFPEVEIIVPLYNAEKYIEELHASLLMQEGVSIRKIHYVLTESKDNSEKILKRLKLKYRKIKKADFSHSLTREAEAKLCKAPIVVFITEDIKIIRKDWLKNLVTPIFKGEVAAAYSRQIPRDDSLEKYTRRHNYPETSHIVSKKNLKSLGLGTFFFSDAASAIDRKVFAELGYYDSLDLPISEDMYITYKLIMNGYKVKYCADSEVVHSHNFSLKEIYGRYYLTGEFFSMFPEISEYGTTSAGSSLALFALKNALKERNFRVLLNFFPNMIARFVGLRAGQWSKKLSRLKIRASHTVSVAMATYNGEKYLNAQLDSILENLRPGDELIISDDGSTDNTLKIIKKYQKKDPRIRLLENNHQGIKQNFAQAIAACQNDIIFLSDQDDVWYKDKIYTVLETYSKHRRATLVVHDAKVTNKNLKVEYSSFFQLKKSGPGVCKNIFKNSYIGCCMAFRKELKSKILPIPDNIEMHDQWIGILSDQFGETVFLGIPLIKYRRHDTNSASLHHYGFLKMLRNRLVLIKEFRKRVRLLTKKQQQHFTPSFLIDAVAIALYATLTISIYYNLSHIVAGVLTILLGVLLAIRYRLKFGYFTNTCGLFALAWFGTIGLAAFQYHPAQHNWQLLSWVAFVGAYVAFLLGYAILIGKPKKKEVEKPFVSQKAFLRLIFSSTCVVCAAFLVEVLIRGFIPAFSDDMAAYVKFSVSGVHYFTVSSVLLAPLVVLYLLCYQRTKKVFENLVLLAASLVAALIPVLIVSRQLFVMTAILAGLIYIYFNRKREVIALLVTAAVVAVGWIGIGNLRNQDAGYLAEALDITTSEDDDEETPVYDESAIKGIRTYMYLACNYDNFDLNLGRDNIKMHYGTNVLFPVFALSGTKFLFPEIFTAKLKQLTISFNTYPLIMSPYLDFGYPFIFIYMFLLGILIRAFSARDNRKFSSVVIRAIIKYNFIFAFFVNFFATASIWFYVIVLILIELIFFRNRELPKPRSSLELNND